MKGYLTSLTQMNYQVARLGQNERDEYLRSQLHIKREQPRMQSIHNIRNYKDKWYLLDLG